MASGKRKQDESNVNTGPRVLVVDDDETIRDILTLILEEGGYQAFTATNAEDALTMFKDDPFPLVFTDLRMSGMDGIELLKKIRETNEDSQVIIITAHASLESSLESLREGAYDYIIKPLKDHSIVIPVVERALEKVRLIVENRYLFGKLQNSCTELESTNKALREITLKDGLTGLYNQRYLKEIIDIELNRSRRHKRTFSVLFCDIDFFKQYNDANGHLLGDKALEHFSQLVVNRLRMTDFASRYGGEEFVLLLPETGKHEAAVLARDICKIIYDNEFEGEQTQPNGRLTVSIGISSYPEDGDSEDQLLNSADRALYQAKLKGRNQTCEAE